MPSGSAYQNSTGTEHNILISATPNAPEGQLAELTDVLRTLLREYIVDDDFGYSLTHVRGGPFHDYNYGIRVPVSFGSLLLWGRDRAAEWVSDWASGKPIPYRMCAATLGLTVDQPLEMAEGIRLYTLSTSSEVEQQFASKTIYRPFLPPEWWAH